MKTQAGAMRLITMIAVVVGGTWLAVREVHADGSGGGGGGGGGSILVGKTNPASDIDAPTKGCQVGVSGTADLGSFIGFSTVVGMIIFRRRSRR